MRKKILFIVGNMESGGVSKSMASMVNTIDTERFEVDLMVVNPTGVFMKLIPQAVNLITTERNAIFLSSFPANMPTLLKKGYLKLFVLRFFSALFIKIDKGIAGWILSRGMEPIQKQYDLAVDFNGQQQLCYLVDKIMATKKITFFHNDYKKWDFYYTMDKKYFPKVDKIFTVSTECVNSLIDCFPQEANKVALFENISNEKVIKQLAKAHLPDLYENAIITIGHLTERKGTTLALEAATILKNRGVDYKWYFLGYNTKERDYEKIIQQRGLQDHTELLGIKANPYPYLKAALIVVHPSKFEGKSIALDEAKILAKPVVVTNFSTVKDQFENGVNATICEMDAEALANAIEDLLTNKAKRDKYETALKTVSFDTSSEINKLYQLIV